MWPGAIISSVQPILKAAKSGSTEINAYVEGLGQHCVYVILINKPEHTSFCSFHIKSCSQFCTVGFNQNVKIDA